MQVLLLANLCNSLKLLNLVPANNSVLKVMNNLLFVFVVITIVSNQTEGGKPLDEEVILPVVGCVAFLSLSKHNKLQTY